MIDVNLIQEFSDITVVSMAAILGIGILMANRKSIQNLSYFAVALSILCWILFGHLLYYPAFSDHATLFGRLNFMAFSIWCVMLYIFILNFPNVQKGWKFKDIIFITIGLIFSILSIFTDLIVSQVKADNGVIVWDMGVLDTFIYGYATLTAIILIYRLILSYRLSHKEDRIRIRLFSFGIVLVLIFNIIFNVFYPMYYSRDDLYWLGDESLIFLLGFTAYAIVKHHLFNIKIIATEATVIILSIALLVETFLSRSITEGFLKAIVWILATYGGYILIKSVKAEIKQREDLQILAKKLDEANRNLEELDETKDNFLSMASHELNTPIAAIEGYLSMIIDEKMGGEINPKAMVYLKNVYNSSKRLAALVKDLLNVSRIESNRIHVIYIEAQIEDVIDQAMAEIQMKAKAEGHSLIFEKPDSPLPKTYLDTPRIIEVLINLIGNSIKYTEPPGKIVVKCHADDGKIVVAVEDNGRGIPKDKEDHVFEKFSQVDVMKDEVKGTGLGMFISKNLIELHKGKLWFKSSVGEDHGTTFYFSLPILKEKPLDPHEGEGALFQSKTAPAAGKNPAPVSNVPAMEKLKESEKESEAPSTPIHDKTNLKTSSPSPEAKAK